MVSDMRLPRSDFRLLLILALLFLVTRLPQMLFMPLVLDEALYAVMIEEQKEAPTLIPTYLGHPISWKPILLFWTYSFFPELPFLPLEVQYRLPSLLFGLATLVPLFYLLRNIGASRELAFLTMVIFIFSLVTAYPHAALLTDSLMFFLMISSLCLYTGRPEGRRYLLAGALAFLAFFVKHILAFMVPALAVAFALACRREMLKSPLFLLSLLAVPIAFMLHLALLQEAGLAEELYLSEASGHFGMIQGQFEQVSKVLGSLSILFSGAGVWLALSIFGVWKHWRGNLVMAFWLALIAFPLVTSYYMPWHFLPVFPAVSFFAALLLLRHDGKERMDALLLSFVAIAMLLVCVLSFFWYADAYNIYDVEREVGTMLAGEENVMIIGSYKPAILSYKMLMEKRSSGEALDVGYIIGSGLEEEGRLDELIRDYHSDRFPVREGSFSASFTSHEIFRKETDNEEFDYVVLAGVDKELDGELVYRKADVAVWRR